MPSEVKAEYYDPNTEDDAGCGKQIKPFPDAWIDASRFKPGDRVMMLEPCAVFTPDGIRELKGQIGVVVRVNSGNRLYPPRRVRHDGEWVWLGDRAGWLTVRFPFDHYGREPDGAYKPRACRLEEEGRQWKHAE